MEAAHEGKPGKTLALVAEVEAHRAELAFDFRQLLGVSIADIGDLIPWWEAADLLEQVASHPGSHYWSKLNGFDEPTTWGDIIARLQAQAVLNMLRAKGNDPIRLPMPFTSPEEEPVTPEERDALVAYARATAPFPLDD